MFNVVYSEQGVKMKPKAYIAPCIALRQNDRPCAGRACAKAVAMAQMALCASHWKSYVNGFLIAIKAGDRVRSIKK